MKYKREGKAKYTKISPYRIYEGQCGSDEYWAS